jgi:hypothetical protein
MRRASIMAGQLRHESAQAKGERIIGEELRRLKSQEPDLPELPNTHDPLGGFREGPEKMTTAFPAESVLSSNPFS